VQYEASARRTLRDCGDGRLLLGVSGAGDAEIGRALLGWLYRTAAEHLGAAIEDLSRQTGLDYARLQLRRQRTRWGSCSSTGTISLNVCLMFQRPEVVRYLLLHELCHRRHMNHSRRFWRLVESFEQDWRALDAELVQGWRNVPAWVFP
jgi:predicted metal-dependent hydrolase